MATDLKKFENNVIGKRDIIVDYSDTISGAGDYQRLESINVLIKSLSNFLLTPIETYPFDPEYGSELYKKVWELNTPETKDEIRYEIVDRIMRYDPRLDIKDVIIEYFTNLKGYRISVTIGYNDETKQVVLDYNQNDLFSME